MFGFEAMLAFDAYTVFSTIKQTKL